MNTVPFHTDQTLLEESASMLKAMAHPTRISIVDLLRNGNRLTVTEIFTALNIEQAVASHHLSILKDRGVLSSNREGKNSFYYLRHSELSEIVDCVRTCCSVQSIAS